MVLPPRESAKYIASQAKHIEIVETGIETLGNILVDEFKSGKLSSSNFSQGGIHPHPNDPYALDWLIVVDTLNFCFWHNEMEEGWKVNGHTGYFALCTAITRAHREEINILDPNFYSVITEAQLKRILRSDTKVECPLLVERIKCLQEVGNVLIEKFEGSFENVVKQSDKSAVKLLNLVIEHFPCFRDEATFNGKKISFYKRGQILIGDIWSCFRNKGIGYFKDIAEITAFADYRIPQTLLWYGIFKYNAELMNILENNTILENGHEMEVEIRGCTIDAVERLKEYVNKQLGKEKINSILIDHFLWDFRRKHAKEVLEKRLPFHKTYSIYY